MEDEPHRRCIGCPDLGYDGPKAFSDPSPEEGFPCGSAGEESTCNVGDLGWEDPLEKGKATHSSILSWGIPWGLRVGHD